MSMKPQDYSVYVVTDPRLSQGRSHEEIAARALEGGASVIQLRDKQATTRELCEIGIRIKPLTQKWGALFIINDRADIAVAIDADGVHVGQDDLPAAAARRLLGPGKVLGVSTENGKQAAQAAADGATYVAIGPIFEARGSKADAGEAIGLKAITELRKHTRLPIVAIAVRERPEPGLDSERRRQPTAPRFPGPAGVRAPSKGPAKRQGPARRSP